MGRTVRAKFPWERNLAPAVVVLGMVLVISVAAVLAFLILPMLFASGRSVGTRSWLWLLYFVAVGLGYILVEIAFIQRFVLFLGHPTYALTVVIFLLLVSSGSGILLSRTICAYVLVLPALLNALVGLPFAMKLLVSGLIPIPVGLAMGMPFPIWLRALASAPGAENGGGTAGNAVEWAWAMNAASSVLGSVLAIVIAIHWGLNITLACGAGAYLAAVTLSPVLKPTRVQRLENLGGKKLKPEFVAWQP